MLTSLHIKDYVIVKDTYIDLNPGFSVLTGETGAGKSILLDALSLTLGQRADAGSIREDAQKTDITAVFSVDQPQIRAWLDEREFHDDTLILRRTVDTKGKSKGFINGVPSTLTQMSELGRLLVSIHGQHAQQTLLGGSRQRQILDSHAGLEPELDKLKKIWTDWQDARHSLKVAVDEAEQQKLDQERLEWKLQELDTAKPADGEWEDVSQRYNVLANASSIMETCASALAALDSDERGAEQLLSQAARDIQDAASHDPGLRDIYESLESASIACKQAVHDLNSYLNDTETDPAQLASVEQRMRQLFDLSKKFHVEPADLPQLHQSVRDELDRLIEQNDIAALEQKAEELSQAYHEMAAKVSKKRAKTAKSLGQDITDLMDTLAMKGGRFEIELQPAEPSAHGVDQVQFLVAGHAGVQPRPLSKIASGGELSRISLALSVIANRSGLVPTLIFDEVDTGIGGAVAEVVGQLLRRLGSQHQVLCVTHLAQIAAYAHHQYEVQKGGDENSTESRIVYLSEDERRHEIARMLGGLSITDTSLEHAQEMLDQGARS